MDGLEKYRLLKKIIKKLINKERRKEKGDIGVRVKLRE